MEYQKIINTTQRIVSRTIKLAGSNRMADTTTEPKCSNSIIFVLSGIIILLSAVVTGLIILLVERSRKITELTQIIEQNEQAETYQLQKNQTRQSLTGLASNQMVTGSKTMPQLVLPTSPPRKKDKRNKSDIRRKHTTSANSIGLRPKGEKKTRIKASRTIGPNKFHTNASAEAGMNQFTNKEKSNKQNFTTTALDKEPTRLDDTGSPQQFQTFSNDPPDKQKTLALGSTSVARKSEDSTGSTYFNQIMKGKGRVKSISQYALLKNT